MAEWEQSKENAMPLKRGRQVGDLGGATSARPAAARVAEEAAAFEARVAASGAASAGEDPLSEWVRYIRWVQDTHPSGSSELLSLFERATREFKDDARYRNNEKYLKVWIGYADLLDNPTSVFKYLREHGIGERLALYYVATAWTAERRGDFSLADKAYVVGLEKKAEPVELLHKRHQEFQRRMSRRWLDQVERERSGQQQVDEAEAEQGRAHLRPLSGAEAARSYRPTGPAPRDQHENAAPRGRARAGLAAAPGHNSQFNDENSFDVFVERGAALSRPDDWGASGAAAGASRRTGWHELTTRGEGQKENSIAPAPWGDQGFGRRADVLVAPAAAPAPAFSVFVEDMAAPAPGSGHKASGSKLKQRAENAPLSEQEAIMKKPLRSFEDAPDEAGTKERGVKTAKATATRTEPLAPVPAPAAQAPGLRMPIAVQAASTQGDARMAKAAPAPAPAPAAMTFAFAKPPTAAQVAGSEQQRKSKAAAAVPVPAQQQQQQQLSGKSKLAAANDEDVTINTRMALEDMFEMFGSPSMKDAEKRPVLSSDGGCGDNDATVTSLSFAVFQDTPPETEAPARHKSVAAPAPFPVFDEAEAGAAAAPAAERRALRARAAPAFSVFSQGQGGAQPAPAASERQALRASAPGSRPLAAPRALPEEVEPDEDQENTPGGLGSGLRATRRVVDHARALKEVDASIFSLLLDDEEEGEAGEREAEDKEEEQQPSEAREEQCVGMPRGFRDVPVTLPAESKDNFVIFEDPEEERESEAGGDDLDGSFSFAPLESILEASHEVDEFAEAAPRTAPKTKPSFSVFQG